MRAGALGRSAELVLSVVKENGLSSQEYIQVITNLSERSVRTALVSLKQAGLVREIADLTDARRKKYKEVKKWKNIIPYPNLTTRRN